MAWRIPSTCNNKEAARREAELWPKRPTESLLQSENLPAALCRWSLAGQVRFSSGPSVERAAEPAPPLNEKDQGTIEDDKKVWLLGGGITKAPFCEVLKTSQDFESAAFFNCSHRWYKYRWGQKSLKMVPLSCLSFSSTPIVSSTTVNCWSDQRITVTNLQLHQV